jgi:hypothetical protein
MKKAIATPVAATVLLAGILISASQSSASNPTARYPATEPQATQSATAVSTRMEPMTKPASTPSPTPVPTPTPDPLAKYFAPEGQEIIVQDPAKWDYWLYKTSTLFVEITKYNDPNTKLIYYVAEIRTRGDEIVHSAFATDKRPGGNNRDKPYLIARRRQAVFLQNGDFLNAEDKKLKGIIIRQGKVFYEGKKEDTMAVMPNGELRIYSPGEITAKELTDMGVQDAFSFGPTLIRDGKINPNISKHRVSKLVNPRSAIGMIEPGHYISIVVEGRQKNSKGVTCMELAQMFADFGCVTAYNLDGGASSSIVFMGNSIIAHDTYWFGQRRVTDVLMLGQSANVPDVKAPVVNSGDGGGRPPQKKGDSE